MWEARCFDSFLSQAANIHGLQLRGSRAEEIKVRASCVCATFIYHLFLPEKYCFHHSPPFMGVKVTWMIWKRGWRFSTSSFQTCVKTFTRLRCALLFAKKRCCFIPQQTHKAKRTLLHESDMLTFMFQARNNDLETSSRNNGVLIEVRRMRCHCHQNENAFEFS